MVSKILGKGLLLHFKCSYEILFLYLPQNRCRVSLQCASSFAEIRENLMEFSAIDQIAELIGFKMSWLNFVTLFE